MLKEGYDHFEITKVPPKVDVCEKRYVFNQVAATGRDLQPDRRLPAIDAAGLAEDGLPVLSERAMRRPSPAPPKRDDAGAEAVDRRHQGGQASSPNGRKKRARGERVPIEPPSMQRRRHGRRDRAAWAASIRRPAARWPRSRPPQAEKAKAAAEKEAGRRARQGRREAAAGCRSGQGRQAAAERRRPPPPAEAVRRRDGGCLPPRRPSSPACPRQRRASGSATCSAAEPACARGRRRLRSQGAELPCPS